MLQPHPSGFNKHIGKWHHHPTYRLTSVYRQNGNQIVIVLVLQCFSLKEDKPRQARPSQNNDVICQGDMEFVTHLTN